MLYGEVAHQSWLSIFLAQRLVYGHHCLWLRSLSNSFLRPNVVILHWKLKYTCTIIVLYKALLLLPSVFQLYEIYAHMGWAYQHIDDPELAVRSYTQAIDIITKHKVRTENIGVFLCFSHADKQHRIFAGNSIIRKLKGKLMISVLTYYQPTKPHQPRVRKSSIYIN